MPRTSVVPVPMLLLRFGSWFSFQLGHAFVQLLDIDMRFFQLIEHARELDRYIYGVARFRWSNRRQMLSIPHKLSMFIDGTKHMIWEVADKTFGELLMAGVGAARLSTEPDPG